MHIHSLKTKYMASNIYVIEEGDEAVIIDPSDADIVSFFIESHRLTVSSIILTHEHCDHTYGMDTVRQKFGCHVLASRKCSENLMDSKMNFSAYYCSFIRIQDQYDEREYKDIESFTSEADLIFEKIYFFKWRSHLVYCRETPGHTMGSISILIDHRYLFSGDSLFKDQFVDTRFKGGSMDLYREETLPWFRSLSSDVVVYPGHFDSCLLKDSAGISVV